MTVALIVVSVVCVLLAVALVLDRRASRLQSEYWMSVVQTTIAEQREWMRFQQGVTAHREKVSQKMWDDLLKVLGVGQDKMRLELREAERQHELEMARVDAIRREAYGPGGNGRVHAPDSIPQGSSALED